MAPPQDFAPGIPSKATMKQIPDVAKPKDWSFVEHIHDAERAGPHVDLRLSDGKTAFSWAVRKGIPAPGERFLAVRQPDHRPEYMGFQGRIESEYGKGDVRVGRSGNVRILKATPNKVQFALLDAKNPQEITMVKAPHYGANRWLIINTSPTVASKGMPEGKRPFKESDVSEIGRYLGDRYIMAAKLDGGQVEVDLKKKVGVYSHRPSTSGEWVNHTYLAGADSVDVPKDFSNSKFRAELIAVKGGKVLPLREIGSLMNSAPQKALDRMKREKIQIYVAPWKVIQHKGRRMEAAPYKQHAEILNSFVNRMPKNWVLPGLAFTDKDKRALFEKIQAGRHRLTSEGIIAWPADEAAGKPVKMKFKDHVQVYIDEVFPMTRGGKEVPLAGGFTYRLTPRGPVVGRVGTGFDTDLRKEMWRDKGLLRGRKAVIESTDQFPSGAYRAPSFISFHL